MQVMFRAQLIKKSVAAPRDKTTQHILSLLLCQPTGLIPSYSIHSHTFHHNLAKLNVTPKLYIIMQKAVVLDVCSIVCKFIGL